MSVQFIRLIPANPTYVPSPGAQKRAQTLLQSFVPQAPEVKALVYDTVRFVDQGEFFESVKCPKCGQELDTAWWQSAMDVAYESQFRDLTVSTPCCAFVTTLNDLDYQWPAGFSRFVLEARDPNVRKLEKEQV